ncbi:unnamed protein product [Sphenostylis stenocarpa]|uniref:Carboxypeptidase n=1 Tax=Sphenostylis stenocarpa TaxID=92480 RepID=A0AA86TJC0_9FABA|nr:unnamed protein product [Sphenostylis stenocarpa]
MASDQITMSMPEERGAGGKLRKPPPRKPPPSPYARPVDTRRHRWISKLVNPAYRLIAGGATRLLPSLFSAATPPSPLPSPTSCAEDQANSRLACGNIPNRCRSRTDKEVAGARAREIDSDEKQARICDSQSQCDCPWRRWRVSLLYNLAQLQGYNAKLITIHKASYIWETGDGHEDGSRKSDIHLLAYKSSEMAIADGISGKLTSSSDLVMSRQDDKVEKSDQNRLSDIEQLVKGKKFSRDEFDHLVAVLNSRVMDLSNLEKGKESTNMTQGLPNVSNGQRNEEPIGAIWGTSKPLGLSKVREGLDASPIEIARAYMDSRALEAGPSSKNMIHAVESTVLHGVEAAIKPYDPTPSKKSTTCWPGAVVQDAYTTPQSQRSRYGLHNFPRTPYSKTLLTKSKSKMIHLQGDNNHISSTPILQSKTAMYLQDKSKTVASESVYGSVGPIRRTRHKVGAQSSSRRPVYSSLNGPSLRESSGVVEGFTPVAKCTETIGTGSTHKPLGFPVGAPTVHMHSSLMAKKILDHIDRNVPTPKEKSAELKLATKWKNSESDFSTISSNEDNDLHKLNDVSPHIYDGLERKKSTLLIEGKGNYRVDMQLKDSTNKSINVRNEETLAPDVNSYNSSNPRHDNDDAPTITLPSGGQPYGVNQEKKPPTNPATIKPVLPPISIKKPESRWTVASDNSSGFTFPVSTSSSVFSEPPTPSIMPLFSAGDQQQSKGSTELSYTFGLKKASPALIQGVPVSEWQMAQGGLSESLCIATLLFFTGFATSSSTDSPLLQQQKDKVGTLPGQSFDVGFAHYAGYITVEENSGRTLFYWFIEALEDPLSKPLVLWLNGGAFGTSILVGNALTDDFHDQLGMFEFMWSSGLISDQTYKLLNLLCDNQSVEHPSHSCEQVWEIAYKELGNIDLYSLFTPKCHANISQLSQLARRKHRIGRLGLSAEYDPCTETHSIVYFNQREVQTVLNVDRDHKPARWETCSEVVNTNWKDSPTSMLNTYHELIRMGLKIWVFSGNTDAVIPVTSTRYSINALNLPTVSPWRAWYDDGEASDSIMSVFLYSISSDFIS